MKNEEKNENCKNGILYFKIINIIFFYVNQLLCCILSIEKKYKI